ncbi:angiotensin-converting enzyme-like protein Ace3 isoform X2 [Bos javanicus]|uniref:angiotensin-converting enzyme-like protein Ace3 isoform X2 n=1 Tax=Bos javanicus TaxID=9906 RepID=UPI002AA776DA|nr:angiotensin-converting enzyme-like protein Ace3 isoform X2 [Bos javanicus]
MELDRDWATASSGSAVLLVMGTRWTCPGPSLLVLFCCAVAQGDQDSDQLYNETVAKAFLEFYERTAQVVWNQFMAAAWNYVTNITKKNQEEMLYKDVEKSQHTLYFGTRARMFKIANFQDSDVKRMLSKLLNVDKAALPKEELREYNEILAYMETTYSMAQVCLNEGPCLPLEPDLEEVMATSRDQKELLWAWQGWRDAVGRQLRMTFERYVQLSNKAAKLNGNMWAQSWVNILDLALPFPEKPPEDITKIMQGQHWKPEKMFQEAEKFFTSMGLLSTPPEFWKNSMMERPTDGREVECHASAWDFYNGKDFRIKKCTEVTIEDLLSIFHQMGHIQYFLQYKNLSVIFRAGANPAFEEAVGSVVTLSASSHKHLLNRGLLSQQHQDKEEEVNFLMSVALEKIAFIPFAYLMDLFRWKVFDGTIEKDVYNQEWWNLRLKYQGLCPPIPRTEEDFDPGAKFHISASLPYIRYFLSLVLQFQFHEALCKASGHMGPLHRCDIYNSKEAGKLLEDVLKLGSSKPWPEVLEKMTGETKVSTKALMTYFKPLLNWLVTENVRQGEILGWPDFSCSFEERETSRAAFLGMELNSDQVKSWQWTLLALSFVMLLAVLLLGRRLYTMEKSSLTQDTSTQDTWSQSTRSQSPRSQDASAIKPASKACFLGIAMEPHQVVKRQWMLLGLCLLLMLCSIGLIIWIFTQHNRKPPWMRDEWGSWD